METRSSGWISSGSNRMTVRVSRKIVVKMVIALFISVRWEVLLDQTTIGAKMVAISVRKEPGVSLQRQTPKTMLMQSRTGMSAK